MTTISVRELKAKTSELLREVSQKGRRFVITRNGRSCAELIPVSGAKKVGRMRGKILRGAFARLPELTDRDFEDVKKIWPPT